MFPNMDREAQLQWRVESEATSVDHTLWQSRVFVLSNDDNQDTISEIRNISASLTDLLQAHKEARSTMDWEIARLYDNAMIEIEGACMWSIKAVTK